MTSLAFTAPSFQSIMDGSFYRNLGLYIATEDYIRSEELNRLIEQDYNDNRSLYGQDCDLLYPSPKYELEDFLGSDTESSNLLDSLPETFSIMVNPRTGMRVTDPFRRSESPKKPSSLTVEPHKLPKPYHPYQDHDYLKIKEEDDDSENSSALQEVENLFNSENEPVVEVWEIDNFEKEPPADPVPRQLPSYRQRFKKETRRVSTRTVEIRRREQARKISNAVRAVFKNEKAQRTRQYKNIKPKNSVETTPSQSDIEEWCSQPMRPTSSKITKKKTSKGRIDHSESERHRREVLRTNFSSLCDLIPHEYLRGEKVSSQISKQKILNGAKAYILAIHSAKSSYKSTFQHNRQLRERWQKKNASKPLKCKKQK